MSVSLRIDLDELAAPARAPLLSQVFARMFSTVKCAPVTLLNHEARGRYLVDFFGDRPIEDFAGEAGGALVAKYIRDEGPGGRDRGLRERFSGPGNLVRHLSYNSIRQRLATFRLALLQAVEAGELSRMPDPWPIPRPGSHGHLQRGTFFTPDLQRAYAPPKPKILPPTLRATGSDRMNGDPKVETLRGAGDEMLAHALRRRSKTTRFMHSQHLRYLCAFFGGARPLSDFESTAGYRLITEFVETEGPEGRGIKFVTVRKRLVTLRMILKEAIKRGSFILMPPWPDMPFDAKPRERYLTYQEYRKLRVSVREERRVWVDIGVYTGQHSSDLASMTWGMVNLGKGPDGKGIGAPIWLRRNTKNRSKPLWLPMPAEMRAALVEELQRLVRVPGADERIAGEWPDDARALRRGCWKADIPVCSPIDFRRTCATWWIEGGGPKDGIRKWLGHAYNSAMIDRHYSQITPGMLEGGVNALNRAATVGTDKGSEGQPSDPGGAP